MGSDLYLSGYAEKGRAADGEAEIMNLQSRLDAALKLVRELEVKNERLSDENAELHEAIGKTLAHRGDVAVWEGQEDRYVAEIEALREDNARLIRAVCALAEGEVKRSEVGDECGEFSLTCDIAWEFHQGPFRVFIEPTRDLFKATFISEDRFGFWQVGETQIVALRKLLQGMGIREYGDDCCNAVVAAIEFHERQGEGGDE